MLKENKGITLIALVITIIVLLILAGVSIAMIGGDEGILTQAKTAEHSNGALRDAITLGYSQLVMEDAASGTVTFSQDEFLNAVGENYKSGTVSAGTLPTGSTAFTSGDGKVAIASDDAQMKPLIVEFDDYKIKSIAD